MSKPTPVSHSGDSGDSPRVSRGAAKDGASEKDIAAFGIPKVKRQLWPFKFSLEDNRWFITRSIKRTLPPMQEALF